MNPNLCVCVSVLQSVAECCRVLQCVLQSARPFAFDHPSQQNSQLVSECVCVFVCVRVWEEVCVRARNDSTYMYTNVCVGVYVCVCVYV